MENKIYLVQLKYSFYPIAVKVMIPLRTHVPSSWYERKEDMTQGHTLGQRLWNETMAD